ncbi:hypothetical protein DERP_014852 [Dermatophagoides pteronyssinus]|uniref:Uncharacterized protein n=1 Tax=Dermatophagoides pteronyssinus TaxID=6956 RepID=A0ABQ8JBA1_DERPT|nr:hypothetical protein DERP_014852 [Dermatophagoides pteronyssinus]
MRTISRKNKTKLQLLDSNEEGNSELDYQQKEEIINSGTAEQYEKRMKQREKKSFKSSSDPSMKISVKQLDYSVITVILYKKNDETTNRTKMKMNVVSVDQKKELLIYYEAPMDVDDVQCYKKFV